MNMLRSGEDLGIFPYVFQGSIEIRTSYKRPDIDGETVSLAGQPYHHHNRCTKFARQAKNYLRLAARDRSFRGAVVE